MLVIKAFFTENGHARILATDENIGFQREVTDTYL